EPKPIQVKSDKPEKVFFLISPDGNIKNLNL
ncbi:MAG: hypothetical protein ACI96L_000480, partial [Paracoccaceae bacterium]